ncbi:multidrug efflux pump subunit AcrA (membrane-fusion protein) [Nocardioides sp. BE266]|uniref:coiled-coil domain-containing protein n=1 Tax=Nocardioides sp. BE266 TaxID=2817725 RepID=UPI002860D886|nr:hypothetical protein [Nocardioides sp. BE266]MDR7254484.1 multidrug efflux pump subunit AcrA (membrane-fusion protein) [Nocardioides sp. BE266]
MRLLSAVLGFALKKLGLFAGVVLTLFLGLLLMSALIPVLREAEAERDRLEQVAQRRADLQAELDELSSAYDEAQAKATETLTAEVEAEVDAGTGRVADQEAEVDDRRGDVCGRLESLAEEVLPGPNPCEDAQKALDAAEDALATFEENLADARAAAAVLADPSLTNEQKLDRLGEDGGLASEKREIDNTSSELAQAEADESRLRKAQNSVAGRVVDLWARSWKWLVWTALLLVLAPGLLRVVSYFVLMPLVKRAHRPIHLAGGPERGPTVLRTSTAQRTLTVRLDEGEVLSARSEHVRPVQGQIRSRLLYDWSAPFISFAAGLYGLSRVTGDGDATSATLATPDDPDSYLMRIDFEDHPGLVMRPRHVVGVIGAPELETRWRWGIQSLATWQVRYIMFAGTGSLIVQGSGDVVATDPGGRSTRMEQNLVMGFDSRLVVGVNRTEVFWPYLWGRTPLVDDEFAGAHPLFWQKSSGDGPSNPIAKVFDAFYSAFGKVLGF